MAQTSTDDDPRLRAVEEDIRFGESLVGRIAALAATSSAKGRACHAREARRLLATAEEILAPLYTLRNRLRDDPAQGVPRPRVAARGRGQASG